MIKVKVWEDLARFSTHILIYNVSADGTNRMMLRPDEQGYVWDAWAPHTEPIPTFTLESELIPLLYQELHRLYGGPAEVDRNLREDFQREQWRVDRLIDALIKTAYPLLPVTVGEIKNDD